MLGVIAVNAGCENEEKKLEDFISKEVPKYGIEVLEFKSQNISEIVEEAKEADQVILVCDAEVVANNSFTFAARELYKNDIKPILLISNSDKKNADISSAKNELGDIWLMENPSLEPWDLNFDSLYFSYEKMGIDTIPEVRKTGVEELINLIKS